MNLIRRVVVLLRALSDRFYGENERDILSDDRNRRKFECSTIAAFDLTDYRHTFDFLILENTHHIDYLSHRTPKRYLRDDSGEQSIACLIGILD